MKRKIRNLKYKKERVILSDVLPYELPVTFSNRYFYSFLLEQNVQLSKKNVTWKKDDDALDCIIRLLFGVENAAQIKTAAGFNTFEFPKGHKGSSSPVDLVTIPFGYKISHKEKEYRELTICHPRNQVEMINFYHSYKETILYYSTVSPFSIRRPHKLSKFVFYKDKIHYDNLVERSETIEEYDKEYENLKSFFVYRDYSNIHKFYESYKYHRCEKKYNKLMKLDISKCFDTIYTHSLAWALINKESVKKQISSSSKKTALYQTFPGRFDTVMQQLNYSETNGIIIGPEFSRIFAELILQTLDKDLCSTLQNKPYEYYHKKDYEIFRYVDDYFIFYNQDEVKDIIVQELQIKLKAYKLSLNNSKAIIYEKPIITELSIARRRIAQLLDENLSYKIKRLESKEGEAPQKEGRINIYPAVLITQFKTIIKECKVEYKDVLIYALSIIERTIIEIIKDYNSINKKANSEQELIDAILGILEFTFFIYSVSPRANTTIRLCRILNTVILFLKRKGANTDCKHLVFKLIYDNICFILQKNRSSDHTQIETLYLLITLPELGKDYWLDRDVLHSYFNITKDSGGSYKEKTSLNYFSLVVLLFYMKNKKRYAELRDFIEETIKKKFEAKITVLYKDAELTLLLFDVLKCPYINLDTKKYILTIYGVDIALQDAVINKREYWFTKWTDFDFGKELDAKRSHEVY